MSQRRTRTLSLARAASPVIDSLEQRTLMSAAPATTPATVVDVTFRGVTAPAIQGSFNVGVKAGVDFTTLAAKAGFSAVTSLGANFYNFYTQWTPAKLSSWAKNQGSKLTAVSPNYTVSTAATVNDPLYAPNQWHLNNTGQTIANSSFVPNPTDPPQAGTAGADISAEAAWDITRGSSDVVIAVLDTGLDIAHPDIAPNVWTNPLDPVDGVDNDGNGYIDDTNGYDFFTDDNDITDFGAHGTWVSGVIAGAGNNSLGISGVSQVSKIMAVKVFSDIPSSSTANSIIIQGINYTTDLKRRGINIAAMNLSLGGGGILLDTVYARAVQNAQDAGIVFVAAAGNDGLDIDRSLSQPARQAFAAGALVVAATDNQDNLASFSNYGKTTVQVAAPGVQIFTTHSKDATATDLLTGLTISSTGSYTDPVNGGAYESVDGTSFAAPVVSGIVALAKSAYPQATVLQIVQAIKDGADRIPGLTGVNGSGNARVSTGGRVNAYNTLQLLGNRLAGQNSVTQGNWVGNFGSTASFVYGGTTGTPALAFLNSPLVPASASVETFEKIKASAVSSDARLLLTPDSSSRSSSFLASGQTVSYSFDFATTDANSVRTPVTRRLSIYAVDADKTRATQTINIVDPSTGTVLQSVSMANFQTGRYVSFDLTGAVRVDIVPANGRDVIVNGLFVDSTPTSQVLATDTLTKGNWISAFGDQGYILPGTAQSLPANVSYGTNAIVTVGRSSSDALVPESISSAKTRSAGLLTTPTTAIGSTFDLTITRTDTAAREVTLYAYNTSKTPRTQRIQQLNANGVVVASIDVVLTKSGQYSTFFLSTDAADSTTTFRVTSLGGGAPSIAGVFFSDDSRSANATNNSASFIGIDSTTSGNWRKTHTSSGAYIVGASSELPLPFVGPLVKTGTTTTTISSVNTRNTAAPLNPNTLTGRIAASISSQSSFDIALDSAPTDETSNLTRISAYFVDLDKKSRVQDVSIVDATSGEVLSTVRVRDFAKGKYVTWDITGNVILRITRVDGPSAVFNALFVD